MSLAGEGAGLGAGSSRAGGGTAGAGDGMAGAGGVAISPVAGGGSVVAGSSGDEGRVCAAGSVSFHGLAALLAVVRGFDFVECAAADFFFVLLVDLEATDFLVVP